MKIERWEPENPEFWEQTARPLAWRALWVTTFALLLSFATWFIWSAAVVHLNNVGFKLSVQQRFWLAAMPGLAGATWRLVHSFLILRFGSRTVVTLSTASLLVPAIGLGLAVQNPNTPYGVLLLLAAGAGFGGGNFSSFMPSTSLHFPRARQGTALGVQAGLGNFGVSLAQFLIPLVIATPLFGALGGPAQTWTRGDVTKQMWLQNAGFIWVLPILISTVLAWWGLNNLPLRKPIKDQFRVFQLKHTWIMLVLYIMTFGSFSGLSASFPLLIKELFGSFPNAPEPLAFAFLGPLIGSATRPPGGWVSDKIGGGLVTLLCAVLLGVGSLVITVTLSPASAADFPAFLTCMLLLFFAAGIGNGSTFQQIPFIFPPQEAGPVLGFTAAVAAYGAFVFPALFGWALGRFGSVKGVFLAFAVFYALCAGLTWWYYARPNCERPCRPLRTCLA
jgi:NNP family nitrate/nitrite transporter-like MFS transporter